MNYVELRKRFIPKKGLRYLFGTSWHLPWVITFKFSFNRTDKIKFKVASSPKSDLAYAYYLGVQDGSKGKIEAQHQGLGCRDPECFRCKYPSASFPKLYGVVDDLWVETGRGTKYLAGELPIEDKNVI